MVISPVQARTRLSRENPARTDELVGEVDVADAADVDAAVAAARAAQRAWARLGP